MYLYYFYIHYIDHIVDDYFNISFLLKDKFVFYNLNGKLYRIKLNRFIGLDKEYNYHIKIKPTKKENFLNFVIAIDENGVPVYPFNKIFFSGDVEIEYISENDNIKIDENKLILKNNINPIRIKNLPLFIIEKAIDNNFNFYDMIFVIDKYKKIIKNDYKIFEFFIDNNVKISSEDIIKVKENIYDTNVIAYMIKSYYHYSKDNSYLNALKYFLLDNKNLCSEDYLHLIFKKFPNLKNLLKFMCNYNIFRYLLKYPDNNIIYSFSESFYHCLEQVILHLHNNLSGEEISKIYRIFYIHRPYLYLLLLKKLGKK